MDVAAKAPIAHPPLSGQALPGSDWCSLDIRKRLQTAQRVFELDVQLRSAAPRIALMGPSGIGKTVLLRAIAGLSQPDEGHIQIGQTRLFDSATGVNIPTRNRQAGYLFQNYALLPHLDALANAGFGLRRGAVGWLSRAQKEQAMHWLERFGLAEQARQYPHTLSGGQQQRLALARIAVLKPRVLLLDEPFSALDAALREAMREQVDYLLNMLGIPMVMVSHDEADSVALQASKVRLVQRDGRTVVQADQQANPRFT